MRTLIAAIILLVSLAVTGCKNKAALDENNIPGKLIIGVYGEDNPGRTSKIMEPIRSSLEKELGIPVEILLTTDYTAVIEGIHSKKIHIAYLGPFSYVLAAKYNDIEPIAAIGLYGKPYTYRSNIFCRASSGINSMVDVKAKAKSLSLCFTDPASTSGHLVPRSYLNSIGLNPDNAFKETMFAGSHAAAVLTVSAGKVDIGCAADEYGIDMLVKRGMIKKGELKKIWISDPIVGSPIVIRKDINKDFAKKIQQFYFNMARDEPSAFQKYVNLYYTHPPAALAYVGIQDSLFNGIRKMAGEVKDLKLAN